MGRGGKLKETFAKTLAVLTDTTIENTMAGAVRRLERFDAYRENDKATVYADCSRWTPITLRLQEGWPRTSDPPFVPDNDCSVEEFYAQLAEVEKREAAARGAQPPGPAHQDLRPLHRSLQRARRLGRSPAHVPHGRSKSGLFALNRLEAYFIKFQTVSGTIPVYEGWAQELLANKFEHGNRASTWNDRIAAAMGELEKLSARKKVIHDDGLARELVKAHVLGLNCDRESTHAKLSGFVKAPDAALSVKEQISSIKDAKLHSGLTRAIDQERRDRTAFIAPMRNWLGQEILTTQHHPGHSDWEFLAKDELKAANKRWRAASS